jgi:hypothetical protein
MLVKRNGRLGAMALTIRQVFAALGENRLHALIPVVVLALLAALALAFLNLTAPLAPFVYALF